MPTVSIEITVKMFGELGEAHSVERNVGQPGDDGHFRKRAGVRVRLLDFRKIVLALCPQNEVQSDMSHLLQPVSL